MHAGAFRKAGHTPTLVASFLHFDVSFMCWVLLGALGVPIAESFGLTPSEKGLMVAVPLLAGAGFRIVLGLLADRVGARRVGIASLAVTAVPLLYGWLALDSLPGAVAAGLLLGVAGASFAVSLPLASRWYPPEHQGLAMGIAGAGNSGTVLATLFAPRLAQHVGWHGVFGLALIPIGIVLLAFVLLARDAPGPRARAGLRSYGRMLRQRDAWIFCAFYAVTFGGFAGLSSSLPIVLHDEFRLSTVTAGTVTGICAIAASLLRPCGGFLADRLGGTSVLSGVFVAVSLLALGLSTMPATAVAVALLIPTFAALGTGNGAIFQLVPLRFRDEIGSITGLVGAAGGVGGFVIAYGLGLLRETTGSYAAGVAMFAGIALLAFGALVLVRPGWFRSWAAPPVADQPA